MDRRTDRHDEVHSRFSKFCEHALKRPFCYFSIFVFSQGKLTILKSYILNPTVFEVKLNIAVIIITFVVKFRTFVKQQLILI
jgi:hypothetical protein